MKKLTAILLALLMLTACTADTDDIAAGLETYREAYSDAETDVPYTAPEETADSSDRISCPDFTVSGGKYYFPVKHRVDEDQLSMIAYVDLATGNSGLLCQDPLCSHTDVKTCKYLNLTKLFPAEEDGIFYAQRDFQLLKLDLNTDTVTQVHTFPSYSCIINGYDNGHLYFSEYFQTTTDRQTVEECLVSYLDTASGEIMEVGYIPQEIMVKTNIICFILNGEFYFSTGGHLLKTDSSIGNLTDVTGGDGIITHWFLDASTDELYYSCTNDAGLTGSLYVYRDGVTEKLALPHENIYTFTITGNKIYYSPYDPIYYGISAAAYLFETDPEQYKVYDYTGGKVYAVDRDNPSGEAELVYHLDGNNPLATAAHNYVVLGDYLYFDEITVKNTIINGVEYTYFSSAETVSKIRVGLKDGSFTRISFD